MNDGKVRWVEVNQRLRLGRPSGQGVLPEPADTLGWIEYTTARTQAVRFRGRDGIRAQGQLDVLHKIWANVLSEIYEAPDCVFGFVGNKSTLGAASRHIGQPGVLVIDLKSFFEQVTVERVVAECRQILDDDALSVLIGTCMVSRSLPLGFRTSPVLSNIVFRWTDSEIHKLCESRGVAYSRWVDDLIFSGEQVDDGFLEDLHELLARRQWVVNDKKTRFLHGRRIVLGLNISEELPRAHVLRKMKRRLRLNLHYLQLNGMDHFKAPNAWSPARILGTIGYVRSIDPELAALCEHKLQAFIDNDSAREGLARAGGGAWQVRMLRDIGVYE